MVTVITAVFHVFNVIVRLYVSRINTSVSGTHIVFRVRYVVCRFPFLGKLLKLCGYTFQICCMCGTARKKTKNNGMTACDNLGCKGRFYY